jgi:hypothetical protein
MLYATLSLIFPPGTATCLGIPLRFNDTPRGPDILSPKPGLALAGWLRIRCQQNLRNNVASGFPVGVGVAVAVAVVKSAICNKNVERSLP